MDYDKDELGLSVFVERLTTVLNGAYFENAKFDRTACLDLPNRYRMESEITIYNGFVGDFYVWHVS